MDQIHIVVTVHTEGGCSALSAECHEDSAELASLRCFQTCSTNYRGSALMLLPPSQRALGSQTPHENGSSCNQTCAEMTEPKLPLTVPWGLKDGSDALP